jgi:hypothetical protein
VAQTGKYRAPAGIHTVPDGKSEQPALTGDETHTQLRGAGGGRAGAARLVQKEGGGNPEDGHSWTVPWLFIPRTHFPVAHA